MKHSTKKSGYLSGSRIDPKALTGKETVWEAIEGAFTSYNGARLREACQLLAGKMLAKDSTVGMSLTGALTPAGSACPAWCRSSRPASSTGSSRPAPTSTTTPTTPSA